MAEALVKDVKWGLCGQECRGQRTGVAPRLSHYSSGLGSEPVWALIRPRGLSVSEFMRTLCKVNSVSCEVLSSPLPFGYQPTQCV